MKFFALNSIVILVLVASLALASRPGFNEIPAETDSNAALYEGESLNYVFHPPRGFRMVDDESVDDGYSFAFIPQQTDYDSANLVIGVNIYKIRGMAFTEALTVDTASIREHYGTGATIRPIDSVLNGCSDILPTFYIDNKSQFIPNVMIAYFNGSTEMIIFELVISDSVVRFEAEDIFIDCILRFKALKRGELGAR